MEEIKRQVAFKVKVSDILNGEYKKQEGWLPNYVLTDYGKISRVNIIAVLVSKDHEQNSFIIDDGSGKIDIRSFENKNFNIEVGDVVIVIGRPREWNAQRYIVPEIIKKLENSKWIEVRKLELEKRSRVEKASDIEIEEEIIVSNSQRILDAINSLDTGDGANYDEVLQKSKLQDANKKIKELLEQGEIYELKPGRLKVLE